jgi:HEPN domain-containing protein
MLPDATSSEQLNKFREVGKSWFSKAENALNRAEEEINRGNYSDSVSSSLDCIEFSIKSIFLFYGFKFPKIHKVELEIEEKEILKKEKSNSFRIVLEKLETILTQEKFPPHIKKENIIKCFFYFKFWGEFYTLAKYGSLRLGVGGEKLFGKKEAELALSHAKECKLHAYWIKDHMGL